MFTSTTLFHTKHWAKAPGCISLAIAMLILPSCQHAESPADSSASLTINEVRPAVLAADASAGGKQLPQACAGWSLSKEQVARFFDLSRELPGTPSHAFYNLPCTISGTLTENGQRWDFTINAAATATWSDGQRVRHWGCSDEACAALVLLMPEHGEP